MTAPVPDGPLRLTKARWVNRRRTVQGIGGRPSERWSKVLAHQGSYDQFGYGTDTPSGWSGSLQVCIVCAPGSGVIAVDVDDEQAYLGTQTARFTGRDQALSTRGGGFHVLIDARGVAAADWPRQGPIAGGDIKSNGFIPVPRSEHWSGELYKPVIRPNGLTTVVLATRELIAAMHADLAAQQQARRADPGVAGHGGTGGGHDGELAAGVLSMVLRGLSRDECYEQWLNIAVPRDPAWPFTLEDFSRHYAGAVRKAEQIRAEEQQMVTPDAMAWAASTRQQTRQQAQERPRQIRQPGARRPGVRRG